MVKPVLVVHGGAGRKGRNERREEKKRANLYHVCEKAYGILRERGAQAAVVEVVRLLEDDLLFNAGTGSTIQSDGVVRMSAAIMDGKARRFAGVVNLERVRNPIFVAELLLQEKDRVLAGEGALRFAREKGFEDYNPATEERIQEWKRKREGLEYEGGSGTVGAVALDSEGRLFAATSTGGKGMELVGRVSDSATPAGNFASPFAAVSCTGIGEDIIDECVAPSLVLGACVQKLEALFENLFGDLKKRGRKVGAIGVDHEGNACFKYTTETMAYAWCKGEAIFGY